MTGDQLELGAHVPEGPDTYRFHTADGVASVEAFRAAELLLLRAIHGTAPGDHLSVQSNYGVVGVVLAASAASVRMTEASARRARLCRRNAAVNGAAARTTVVADLRRIDGGYDTASYAPESHTPIEVGKQRIADSLTALRPDGRLFVAATDGAGRSRYERCLTELTGDCRTVTTADGCSVLVAQRPASFEPPRYVTPTRFEVGVDGAAVPLVTVPGMFAAGRLDDGTRLLAANATVEDGDRVLDLCCGAGPLGIHAGTVADCSVTLTDDSRVATRAAACSLRAAGIDGRVVTADGVNGVSGERFDRVLCNPPTHAGDGVLASLLDGARRVLRAGGVLLAVHHRDLDFRPHLRGYGSVTVRDTGDEHVVVAARP
ncbi:putative S-adenosylmethionine-dependent methyltransferase [Halolamina pelagica]|uniref:Putative S-adenosylmethionine-dependent methyltransferase n=1 Tax=Halolamina pelagica TaxID=699431 RepID=A0A0N8I077_9EURY|nr:methyltransferase [Halolamina pelagica]KPN31539.1 putative S-adenosylmethionine-dependent methyltransferase [Halolamina pelagica]